MVFEHSFATAVDSFNTQPSGLPYLLPNYSHRGNAQNMEEIVPRSGMVGLVAPVLEPLASLLEIFGVIVIVGGVLVATFRYLRDILRRSDGQAYSRYRANLGRGILLGLEILIGADIIATIVAPLTWTSVGILGLIVLIRTFLSFSLEAEIDGEWPWKRQASTRARKS